MAGSKSTKTSNRGRPSTAHLTPVEKAVLTITNIKEKSKRNKVISDLYDSSGNQKCVMMHSEDCKSLNGHKPLSEFYSVKSNLFAGQNVPICKQCIIEYCTNEDESINPIRLLEILPLLDKPYKAEFIEIANNSKKTGQKVSEYLRVCSFPQNLHLSFGDSDGGIKELEADARNRQDPLDIDVTPQLKIKWGSNMADADVKFLQYTFEKYISYYSVNIDDPVQSGLVEDLCHQDLKIRKARESNKSEKEYIVAKQDLLKTANLTPSQTSKTNTGFTIGGWIKEREETMPISEPKDEFKDVDGIYRIFTKFFGHIVKMMGIDKNGIDEKA